MHVVIIGAGWAGLAAAIELSAQRIAVTVIEAGKQAGGRARCVAAHGRSFDNGQHLTLGAYREMRRLLRVIGVDEQQAFQRRRLHLDMRSPHHERLRLDFPALPAPWHIVSGFMIAEGLVWSERYRALALCAALLFSGCKPDLDISVAEWLRGRKQPTLLIKALWEPLCLAVMNTPLNRASAQVFIHVLREVFGGARADSDLLFPRADLGAVFPEPAIRYIQRQGGTVRLGERVAGLDIRDGRIHGVTTRHSAIDADHVIVAAAPTECLRLIQAHPLLSEIGRQLAELRYEPICTVYLQYPPDLRLGSEMIGLLDGTGQWIIDLSDAGHPGRMAVVISGPGPHMAWDNEDLTARIRDELRRQFPQWLAPSHTLVIREKRATFSCRAGINAHRPPAQTPVEACWLAGDYTATGLPATLEGALRSGVGCARHIISGLAAQGA